MNRFSFLLLLSVLFGGSVAAQTVIKIPFLQPQAFVVQPQAVYKSIENNVPMELGLDTQILGGSGVYSFTWSKNGSVVGTGPTFTITEIGNYILTINDGKGCAASVAYYIDNSTGIKQPLQGDVVLYPNPSNGRFYVQSPVDQPVVRVEVYTADGKLQLARTATNPVGGAFEVNASWLPAGRYLLVAYFDNKKITRVLVIN